MLKQTYYYEFINKNWNSKKKRQSMTLELEREVKERKDITWILLTETHVWTIPAIETKQSHNISGFQTLKTCDFLQRLMPSEEISRIIQDVERKSNS